MGGSFSRDSVAVVAAPRINNLAIQELTISEIALRSLGELSLAAHRSDIDYADQMARPESRESRRCWLFSPRWHAALDPPGTWTMIQQYEIFSIKL